MDIEKAIEREVAHLLKGWEDVEEREPYQEDLFREDTVTAIRVARERAVTLTFEAPENIKELAKENAQHYGALEPSERGEVNNGS